MVFVNDYNPSMYKLCYSTPYPYFGHQYFVFGESILCQTHHGAKWDSSGGMVVDSNEVDEEGSPTYHGWDQKGPNEHLLNPSSACIIQKTQYEKHKVTLKK